MVLGPGGGGAQFNPTISPHDVNRVFVSCDMTGAYSSTDGGESWRMFNLRGVVRFFVFDPLDANTVYAESTGLWRSRDGGKTWNLVYPDPSVVKGVEMPDDHASERIVTASGPADTVMALAVDPADSATLYAATSSRGAAPLLRISKDAGKTWRTAAELASPVRKIFVDPKSPKTERKVYLVGGNSVSVFEGGKIAARPAAPGGAAFVDVSAGWGKEGNLVVYAVTRAGVLVSENGGGSWRDASGSLAGARMPAVAASPSNPAVAYVSYSNLRSGSDRWYGVARTSDFGRTWELGWKEAGEQASPAVEGGWVTERFGPTWGENPLMLGVAPTNPDICFGTDYGRTMRTTDGGKTWRALNSRKMSSGAWTTTGLDVTTNYGIHFDPFDAKHMFITYTDIGLMASEDGGVSWSSATVNGVPKEWVNTTYWLEFDPQVKGRVWAVMSGNHDLPRPKMWRRGGVNRYVGGVVRSDDGGRSWRVMNNGLPQTAATHILLDRRSPAKARVLYVAGFGKGVFKSVDGGETWALKNNGIAGAEPFAWRLSQDSKGVLYLVVARRAEDDSIGTENDGALYRSTDGAESWQRVPLPEGVNGPNGLAIDPADPNRLYLGVWRRTGSGRGGIFLSTDAGRTWRNVESKDQHIYDITVDPKSPSTLYACGFESSAWRSTDRGETWKRIQGYNFKWGHRVIPDPQNPKMIYVMTYGGSVWYGPAAGDPKAPEDIATPVMKP
ncbi:MAG: hypothetical protein ACM336_11665 [Acidobacteriota bacterium]